jgi:hypothetical protein
MPAINGLKNFAILGCLRDQDDSEEYAPPEIGIHIENLIEDELTPHYYVPNFLRPMPIEEDMHSQDYDDLVDVNKRSRFKFICREFG